VDSETGEVELVIEWRGLHAFLSADREARYFAQSASSFTCIGAIVVYDRETGTASIIVDPNGDLPVAVDAEHFTVRRGDHAIDAWLLKPADFDPSRTYPVVLDIHGGPHSWYGHAPSAMDRALVDAGFLVVFSNPRGSGSYGREFAQEVIGDWGGEDYHDLLAVVDAVVERPYADGDRLGVYGYSYGGFMSSWIIGHIDRFKAAVIGAPVVDLVSFYGEADIGHTFGPMQIGGTPTTNPEEYRFRSPLTYLENMTTPALILHGEADDRVPIGQGEQLFASLLAAGREVELVRYPGGSHVSVTRTGFPAHRLDYLERLVGWFERWV
jgi:dipeptidyl aminopeptidase/acylaminoacyl peptidase